MIKLILPIPLTAYIGFYMLPNIDIRQLECLVALVEERSVTAASRRMNLSQPRMSNALRRLREICDDPILIRTGQKMQPTDRAIEIAQHIRDGLGEVALALSPPEAFDPERSDRTFTFMLSDYVEVLLLPEVMRQISALAPSVQLRMRMLETTQVRTLLDDGVCDIAFGFFSDLQGSLRVSTLLRDAPVCIAQKGIFGRDGALSLDEFVEARHVILTDASATGSTLEAHCDDAMKRMNTARHVAAHAPTPHSVARIAASTRLIGLLPRNLAEDYARFLPIQIFTPPIDLGSFDVSMVWHERTHKDAGLVWLRSLFRQLAEDFSLSR